ncbi:hypothetical protein JHK85_035609 [Glycine max]|nr:hypothetical protein JHK85_035609 [Glycine max]
MERSFRCSLEPVVLPFPPPLASNFPKMIGYSKFMLFNAKKSGVVLPGTSLLEAKQEDTCYGQPLMHLLASKATAFPIANWLLTIDFSLCYSLTSLERRLTGTQWTLADTTNLT